MLISNKSDYDHIVTRFYQWYFNLENIFCQIRNIKCPVSLCDGAVSHTVAGSFNSDVFRCRFFSLFFTG
jgi:hypothetical protein